MRNLTHKESTEVSAGTICIEGESALVAAGVATTIVGAMIGSGIRKYPIAGTIGGAIIGAVAPALVYLGGKALLKVAQCTFDGFAKLYQFTGVID